METILTAASPKDGASNNDISGSKVDDVSEAFSRRDEKDNKATSGSSRNAYGKSSSASASGSGSRSGYDSGSNGASSGTPASVYSEATKQIPAWLRKKPVDKYDKYGARETKSAEQQGEESEGSSAAPSAADDRYSKYISRDSSSSRDSRIKRQDDSKPRRGRDEDDSDDERQYHSKRAAYESYESVSASVASYNKPVTTNIPTANQYQQFRSHIENKHERDINSIVRTHYNQKTYHSRSQGSRTKSPIYKLRNFNNTIKYILLGNFVKKNQDPSRPTVILDLCCGKGGDLNKCEFVGANQLIGIDISDASIKEAFKRYSQNKARFIPQNLNSQGNQHRDSRKYNFEACFATGDCFTLDVPEILEPNFPGIINNLFPVDCVSIQFALHYAFETEQKVKTLLNNVSKSLKPGGTFIGTIPSSDFIKEKILKKECKDRKFGNDLYSVTFHDEPPADGVFRPPFGNGYNFSLTDAIDDVPEYVVPFEVFRSMCEDYGLILKYKKNFVDLFNQEIPKYFGRLNKNLIEGMKRSDGKYGAEGSEKEAVAFYLGFVFEKVGA